MRRVIAGEWNLAAAVQATAQATRRFAKRQGTWFRREPGVRWWDGETERERLLDAAAAFLVANPRDAG
jgi:tRNA dimethylallyltransferase